MLTSKYDFFVLNQISWVTACIKITQMISFLHVCCCIGEFGIPHVQGVFTINT